MQFNVIYNRKGEKILKIHGFNEKNGLEAYGQETDDHEEEEDKTLFVNLNRLISD